MGGEGQTEAGKKEGDRLKTKLHLQKHADTVHKQPPASAGADPEICMEGG